MKITRMLSHAAVSGAVAAALTFSALAGHPVSGPKDRIIPPEERPFPTGSITVGGLFSKHLNTGYLDSVTPFWAPGDAMFFLSTRSSIDDNAEDESSIGLGLRYLFPNSDVIIGGNVFYDAIHSKDTNDFEELGFGFEILSRWIDARFNYYLPDNDEPIVSTRRERDSIRTVVGPFQTGNLIQQTTINQDRRRTFRTFEAALEGFNGEIGLLLPGLDRYMEVRVFGGYYHYGNPFGDDFDGFKARLEARLLPGVIADLEYWDDAYVTGSHWTAGARVQVPFSIFNLARGRNPFEGTGEMFKPRQREFRERLSEMVIRSHRVKTITSGDIKTDDRTSTKTTTQTIGVVQAPYAPPPPPPPPPNGDLE